MLELAAFLVVLYLGVPLVLGLFTGIFGTIGLYRKACRELEAERRRQC